MTTRRSDPCEFKTHCDGQGKIQVYVIAFDIYCCIKCAAGGLGGRTSENTPRQEAAT